MEINYKQQERSDDSRSSIERTDNRSRWASSG